MPKRLPHAAGCNSFCCTSQTHTHTHCVAAAVHKINKKKEGKRAQLEMGFKRKARVRASSAARSERFSRICRIHFRCASLS